MLEFAIISYSFRVVLVVPFFTPLNSPKKRIPSHEVRLTWAEAGCQ